MIQRKELDEWTTKDRRRSLDYVRSVITRGYKAMKSSFARQFLGKLPTAHDLEDVTQNTFLNMARNGGTYRGSMTGGYEDNEDFQRWASRVARNTLIRFYENRKGREQQIHRRLDSTTDTRGSLAAMITNDTPSPAENAIQNEQLKIARASYQLFLTLYLTAFQTLDDRSRRVLTYLSEGLTHEAVAAKEDYASRQNTGIIATKAEENIRTKILARLK